MKQNTKATVDFILQDEGPEFNKGGSEPGGGSKFGISMTVLREVRPAATLDQLAVLSHDEAATIYSGHILPQIRFDDLPAGIDYRFADIRVNLGQTGAMALMDLLVQRWPMPGKMDDIVVAWLKIQDPEVVIMGLSMAWLAKKHESPNWNPSPITKTGYGHGWMNRDIAATKRALGLIGK